MKIPIKALLLVSLTYIATIMSKKSHRRKQAKSEIIDWGETTVVVKKVNKNQRPGYTGGDSACLPVNYNLETQTENRYTSEKHGTCESPCPNSSCVQLKSKCCLYGGDNSEVGDEGSEFHHVIKKIAIKPKPLGGKDTCLPPKRYEKLKFKGQKFGACPTPCPAARCQVAGVNCCFYD